MMGGSGEPSDTTECQGPPYGCCQAAKEDLSNQVSGWQVKLQ